MKFKIPVFTFLLSYSLSIKVFEFNKPNGDEKELSTISLLNPVKFQRKLIICSSHRQLQLMLNSSNVYTLYEDQDLKMPWFTMGFWNDANAELWIKIKKQKNYFYGSYALNIIRNWIHICFEFDFESHIIRGSVNGALVHTKYNITDLMDIPSHIYIGFDKNKIKRSDVNHCFIIFRIGSVYHFSYNDEFQFQGMVTNMNIWLDGNPNYGVDKLSKAICKGEALDTNLSWKNMQWNISGNLIVEKNIDFITICERKYSEPISLPFLWKVNAAAEACNKMGTGKVTELSDPANISKIEVKSIYGVKFEKCEYIWTPYNDVEKEGEYVNENTGKVINKFDWEPNSGKSCCLTTRYCKIKRYNRDKKCLYILHYS